MHVRHSGQGGAQLAGALPQRALPSGALPVPARNSAYVWQEVIPFAELPGGVLSTDVPWVIAADGPLPPASRARGVEVLWGAGTRERRLSELLGAARAAGPLDVATLVEIQRDVQSPGAGAVQ